MFKGDPEGAEEVTGGELGVTRKNALSHSWHAPLIIVG